MANFVSQSKIAGLCPTRNATKQDMLHKAHVEDIEAVQFNAIKKHVVRSLPLANNVEHSSSIYIIYMNCTGIHFI